MKKILLISAIMLASLSAHAERNSQAECLHGSSSSLSDNTHPETNESSAVDSVYSEGER